MARTSPQKIRTSDLSLRCKKNSQECKYQDNWWGKILFRRKVVQYVSKTFKLDLICHEKNNFKYIRVDLRVSGKVRWNKEVMLTCVSSNYSPKHQNSKHCIPKWFSIIKNILKITGKPKRSGCSWLWLRFLVKRHQIP